MDKNLPETRRCHRVTETQKRARGVDERGDASKRRTRTPQDRRTRADAGHGLSRKRLCSPLAESPPDLGWGRCGPAKEPGSAAGRCSRRTLVCVARAVAGVGGT
jgi:hypothetical protein